MNYTIYSFCPYCKNNLTIEDSNYVVDGTCYICLNSDCKVRDDIALHYDSNNILKKYYMVYFKNDARYNIVGCNMSEIFTSINLNFFFIN